MNLQSNCDYVTTDGSLCHTHMGQWITLPFARCDELVIVGYFTAYCMAKSAQSVTNDLRSCFISLTWRIFALRDRFRRSVTRVPSVLRGGVGAVSVPLPGAQSTAVFTGALGPVPPGRPAPVDHG